MTDQELEHIVEAVAIACCVAVIAVAIIMQGLPL